MKCLQLSCEEPGTLVCSRCKVAKYCGREHQRASWKEHKLTCQPPPITEYPTEPLFDVYANFERFVNPKPTPGLTLLFSSNRPLPAKPSKKKKTATITPTLEDFKTNFRGDHLHTHPYIYARSTLQVTSIPNEGFTSSIFEGIPEPLFQNVRKACHVACLIFVGKLSIDTRRSLSRVVPSWPACCLHLRIMQSSRVSSTTRRCTVVSK
jgi:hypothetical protein